MTAVTAPAWRPDGGSWQANVFAARRYWGERRAVLFFRLRLPSSFRPTVQLICAKQAGSNVDGETQDGGIEYEAYQ